MKGNFPMINSVLKTKFLPIICLLFIYSCNKTENKNTEQSTTEKIESEPILSPTEKGKNLVEGSDCLGCHQVDAKMIGPSYKEIAVKYNNTPENIDSLAEKIIKGSSGVWGNVPMPAHGFSKENAKFMAQYILSQK